MEAIIVNHDRIYGSIGLYILLVSTLGIIFFAIFFREPPTIQTKK